jgi:hypothetical protein
VPAAVRLHARLDIRIELDAIQLGQTEIPAIVIEAEESDCLVMSLVENCAGASTGRSTFYRISAPSVGVDTPQS